MPHSQASPSQSKPARSNLRPKSSSACPASPQSPRRQPLAPNPKTSDQLLAHYPSREGVTTIHLHLPPTSTPLAIDYSRIGRSDHRLLRLHRRPTLRKYRPKEDPLRCSDSSRLLPPHSIHPPAPSTPRLPATDPKSSPRHGPPKTDRPRCSPPTAPSRAPPPRRPPCPPPPSSSSSPPARPASHLSQWHAAPTQRPTARRQRASGRRRRRSGTRTPRARRTSWASTFCCPR